jgi:hypothetical protein
MNQQASNDDLGPLPEARRSDTLEQISLDALRAALPKDHFLVRDERIDDKGVDGALELKANSRYTNLRAQFQLKGTDSAATNQDGSFSLAIDTSNLNYLLNGTSPLYFLYIAPLQQLRFLWAIDEWKRLDQENPEWRQKQTVTLRFACLLDDSAMTEVHDRLRREARRDRTIRESLAQSTVADEVVVAIDPQSFEVTTASQIYQLLMQSGMTAVCSGYAKQVLERARLLDHAARNESRIRLICGYAEHTLGRFAAAYAHLVEIAAAGQPFTDYDQHFYQSLRNACDLQLHRIDQAEYDTREAALASHAGGMIAQQRQLRDLKHAVLIAPRGDQRQHQLQSLRQLVEQILASDEPNPPFKLSARIELLQAQGSVLIDDYSFAAAAKGIQADLGVTDDTPASLARGDAVIAQLLHTVESANQILEAASALQHPVLFGNALLANASIVLAMLGQRRILSGMAQVPPTMLATLTEHIDKAIEMFAQSGTLDRELRSRLLRADLHEFVGETAEAHAIAAVVHPKAEAMDYGSIAADAQRHLAGTSTWSVIDTKLVAATDDDQDIAIAAQTDDQVLDFARQLHAMLDLPPERFDIVAQHTRCMRDLSLARLSWCRFLYLTDEDPEFKTEVPRRGVCKKHGFQSNIANPDWPISVATFKEQYCAGCSDRSPLRPAL